VLVGLVEPVSTHEALETGSESNNLLWLLVLRAVGGFVLVFMGWKRELAANCDQFLEVSI